MSNLHWWHPSARLWNTLSNLAYPLVGWLAQQHVGSMEAVVVALALTYLGVTSGGYHWFGGKRWQAADWSGMYAIFGALAPWLLIAPFADELSIPLWVFMALCSVAAATLLSWRFRQVGTNGLLAVLLVLALVPAFGNGDRLMVGVALGWFLVGMGVWQLDQRTALLGYWGHAAWHGATALAFGALFLAGVA
jgi:hypothetical protein